MSAILEIELSFSRIILRIRRVGNDILADVSGGNAPHIGCIAVAQPRPSLSGDGTTSATSSVVNIVGHKDEALARDIAETLCRAFSCTVVCTGGFHVDGIASAHIEELQAIIPTLCQRAIDALAASR